MPASGSRGPQSQPNMQWAFRRYGNPLIASLEPSSGFFAYASRINFTGEKKVIRISFPPSRSSAFTSNSQVRCMLSAVPAGCPFTSMAARVSSPWQRSRTRSQASSSAGTSNSRLYTKSCSMIFSASFSLSRQKGSGIRPAVSRSWYTEPGTRAAVSGNALPGMRSRQAPFRDCSFMDGISSGLIVMGLFQGRQSSLSSSAFPAVRMPIPKLLRRYSDGVIP